MLRWNRLALTLVLAVAAVCVALPAPAQASPLTAQWTYFAYEDADGPGTLAYRTFHDPSLSSSPESEVRGIEVVIWQNGYTFRARGSAQPPQLRIYYVCEPLHFRVDFVKYVGNGRYAKFPFKGTLPRNSLCEGSGTYYDLDGKWHSWEVYPLATH
jgi:hypothetical protein